MIISFPVHIVLIPRTIFLPCWRNGRIREHLFRDGAASHYQGWEFGGSALTRGLTAGIHHHRPPDFSYHLTRHIPGAVEGSHENLGKPSTFFI